MTESAASTTHTTEALTTLFALGREVTSVLDLNELLPKIPQLIARLTKFAAFANRPVLSLVVAGLAPILLRLALHPLLGLGDM